MKVQTIKTQRGKRYILLDNNYIVIDPVKRYIKYLDNTGKAPNTLKNYLFHLKTYFEYLDLIGVSYKDICSFEDKGPIDIFADFIGWLEDPHSLDDTVVSFKQMESIRSNKTINLIMAAVLGFYDYLARNNELKNLDVYKTQRHNSQFKGFLYEMSKKEKRQQVLTKRVIKKEPDYITRDDYKRLFDNCRSTRDKLIIALMFEGGLRISEVLGLHIEDIEVWNNRIKIVARENLENEARVKNQAEGNVLLPKYVVDLLTYYLLNTLDKFDTNYLFVNLKGPNPGSSMKAITVQKLFERLSKKLGKKVTPHMCRHGHGTELHEAGWDLLDIKDKLRHKNVQSTTIYTHMSDDYRKKKVKEFFNKKGIPYGDEQ